MEAHAWPRWTDGRLLDWQQSQILSFVDGTEEECYALEVQSGDIKQKDCELELPYMCEEETGRQYQK